MISALDALNELFKAAEGPEEPKERPKPKAWKFKKGELYKITPLTRSGSESFVFHHIALRFLRNEGRHHIFQSQNGGWLTCYTDAQLVDAVIKN